MPEQTGKPVEAKIYELMDHEGFEKWKSGNPEPKDGDIELCLMKFFRERPDMTVDDFNRGVDPLHEQEGD